ncbi:MAG: hypothetical protein KZQ66_02765 [Candidatus Thiodiazotropha sp. (ex Lucinoma aequizonata)]|nr:hypothetical protein [Candidatus Thiodiazotropha sp. (ex Lucinoma aequizonata)]MCU7901058.1 hypothetical protein [Candidatus Thiodiazotropha sp. (ex Lucinoma aequizonata)]
MSMASMKRAAFSTTVLAAIACISSETALAACNATVNGRPMSQQECAQSIQVYGQVIPGDYLVDGYGNWINAKKPMHRGNTYRDAQSYRSGSCGEQSYFSPHGVYDSSGGCEGSSCVNIID